MEINVKVHVVDEECKNCPRMSLKTYTVYGDNYSVPYHTCSHMDVCNWAVKIRAEGSE